MISSSCSERRFSADAARRIALRAQAIDTTLSAERDYRALQASNNWRRLRRCLDTMGVLQIDAVNAVIRSHYLPLYSRLGSYSRTLLEQRLFEPGAQKPSRRTHVEYWAHECSLIPIDDLPLFRWRMQDARTGEGTWRGIARIAREQPAFVESVLASVREQGPLCSRDLGGTRCGTGMWEWSETKLALEYLFWSGQLVSAGRRGFDRLYDLPENALPAHVREAATPDRLQAHTTLMHRALQRLGVATERDMRDYFRLTAKDAHRALAELQSQGRVQAARVDGWREPAWCVPDTRIPRRVDICRLLSPFDPIVWNRQRALRLYAFNYRIEIYVPEQKRQYGYFVMPFLYGDSIGGRLDLKARRDVGELHVQGAWREAHRHLDTALPARLARELRALAEWLGLERVRVMPRGDLADALSGEIATAGEFANASA